MVLVDVTAMHDIILLCVFSLPSELSTVLSASVTLHYKGTYTHTEGTCLTAS